METNDLIADRGMAEKNLRTFVSSEDLLDNGDVFNLLLDRWAEALIR